MQGAELYYLARIPIIINPEQGMTVDVHSASVVVTLDSGEVKNYSFPGQGIYIDGEYADTY